MEGLGGFTILLCVFLPWLVTADPDPTTVCMPKQLQFDTYDLRTDRESVFVVDFDKGFYGFSGSEYSFVQDMNNLREYLTHNDTCNSYDIPKEALLFRCLPAGSIYLGDFYIGFGASALPFEAWEVAFNDERIRYAYSKQPGEHRYPLLAQIHEAFVSSSFSTNPTTNITAPWVIEPPADCPYYPTPDMNM